MRAYRGELDNIVDESYGPFDAVPFIWKKFAKSNYSTAFLEDHPDWTLFNYLAQGFTDPPTDFYPRPFWLRAYHDELSSRASTSFCYNEIPKIDVLFEQAASFYKKGLSQSKPTFTFTMYIEAPHNNFNRIQLLDEHIANFMANFPNMNETVFILAGDHGNRFGSVLETVIGKIEERMPYVALFMPKPFIRDNPSVARNLKANERRLTTWLDMHETLLDLLDLNFVSRTAAKSKRAYSLWREVVPPNRTCDEALIPPTYCVCDDSKPLNTSLAIVSEASAALIEFVNLKVADYDNCSRVSLSRIKSAEVKFARII